MKTVGDVMQHKARLQRERLESEGLTGGEVYSIPPIASVFEAIQMMSDHHVGALPVMIEGKLVGIVSERDYARKVILKDKSSKTTRVSEIMTRDVISVSTQDRMSDCVDLMTNHHIRHLVVVDQGEVSGMLSLRDLFMEIIDEQSETIDQLEGYIRGGH